MDPLKRKLEYHYKTFDKSQISPDPLEFPHRFENPLDIEIAGFIASIFAYGNVQQIISNLNKIFNLVDNSPLEFLKDYSFKMGVKIFDPIKHRFYTHKDIAALFFALKRIYEMYGSLEYLFLLYHFANEPNLKNSIRCFSQNLLEITLSSGHESAGIKFMYPDPYKGSACKRMNLFLRWMIRKDELDFGIWEDIPTSKLVIPVDTHVAAICKKLKLTRRKNVSWAMAEEITNNLKKFDPNDPVKYDFAICHIGMRKLRF